MLITHCPIMRYQQSGPLPRNIAIPHDIAFKLSVAVPLINHFSMHIQYLRCSLNTCEFLHRNISREKNPATHISIKICSFKLIHNWPLDLRHMQSDSNFG